MYRFDPRSGLGTLASHTGEKPNPHFAHTSPIYMSSTFNLPDVDTAAAIFHGDQPGYVYTRWGNPNFDQLAEKIAVLEGLDLLRAEPLRPQSDIVAAMVFNSGMSAVTTAILSTVKPGQKILAQESLYSATFTFLRELAPSWGIEVIWQPRLRLDPQDWEAAFQANPGIALVYAKSPANPAMTVVDLQALAETAHRHGAWVMVDNTFASPYCQRPLSLGADVVVHSTTKYLSGHGLIIGGAVVSRHVDFVSGQLTKMMHTLGGAPSPFDCWLASTGLKTFELRMQRHCANAVQVANTLANHPSVAHVNYPGLPGHPGHAAACRQMPGGFGGMMSFELKGGLPAGARMMNTVKVASLAVSLGSTDTLICHSASTTHSIVPPDARLKMGITDGLVRLSVGIENVEDILADLDQAMR